MHPALKRSATSGNGFSTRKNDCGESVRRSYRDNKAKETKDDWNDEGGHSVAEQTRRQRIEEMLAEDPNDAFLRYGLAMEMVGAGDDGGAASCLEELLKIDATYVPAYQQCGQCLLRLGRVEEAREVLRAGVAKARALGNVHAAEEMMALDGGI